MSYDLYFYKKKGHPITEEQVALYLAGNLPFNSSEHPKQFNYENPDTGVYFMIDWNEPLEDDPESDEYLNQFDDFEYLNFSFSINFIRPGYFGLETFRLIEKYVKELDLFVLNAQDDSDDENVLVEPKKFPPGYWQHQWHAANEQIILDNFSEIEAEYMPADKSNYLWWYQFHRQQLEDSLNEDIFVPNTFILKMNADGKLYSACVWPQHIPIILPPVDFVLIGKEHKKLEGDVEESGLVSYENIMKEMGNYFENFEYEIPRLKVLMQENANKLEQKFNDLKLGKTIDEIGGVVGWDGFVNVKPQV
jgi:hypothetical protein